MSRFEDVKFEDVRRWVEARWKTWRAALGLICGARLLLPLLVLAY